MSKLAFNRLYRFFNENCPRSDWCLDEDIIIFDFEGKNADFEAMISVFEENLHISIQMPKLFPENHFWDISKAVCCVNQYIQIGRFNWEYEQGILDFQAWAMFGDRLDDTVINRLIRVSLITVDSFAPIFRKIIAEGVDPNDAIDLHIHDEQIRYFEAKPDTDTRQEADYGDRLTSPFAAQF